MTRQIISLTAMACGALLLAVLVTGRAAAAGGVKVGPAAVLDTEEPAWSARLKEPVELEYEDAPLAEVAADLSARYRVPVRVDEVALERIGLSDEVPITLTVSDISLHAALDLLLREHELTWMVHNEQLTITSYQEAEHHLLTRVYPVGDLVRLQSPAGIAVVEVGTWDNYDPLIDLITATIRPMNWEDVGGYGSISAYDTSQALVISHCWQAHKEIEDLLTSLREARVLNLGEAAAKEEVDDNGLVLRVYRVLPPRQAVYATDPQEDAQAQPLAPPNVEDWTNDLGETLVEFIEPESWEQAGGSGKLRAAAGLLFIRQTPGVHDQIQAVLSDAFEETYQERAEPEGLGNGGGFGQQF